MPNHYHLLVETPQGHLSAGMRQLNGVYTQRFNRHHGRVGHVFQGRFKATVVERDTYLLELCRYIGYIGGRYGFCGLQHTGAGRSLRSRPSVCGVSPRCALRHR